MATIQTDAGEMVNLGTVSLVKFKNTSNPPVNETAFLDGEAPVSLIAELGAIRSEIGVGNGSSGWVRLDGPDTESEAFVQLDRVSDVSFSGTGLSESATLRRGATVLGEVRTFEALEILRERFPST